MIDPTKLVRKLEWVKHPYAQIWRSDTPLGTYKIFGIHDCSWDFDSASDKNDVTSRVAKDTKSAKAAAQADYAARIIAALDQDALAAMLAEAEARGAAREREACATRLADVEAERDRAICLANVQKDRADATQATADMFRETNRRMNRRVQLLEGWWQRKLEREVQYRKWVWRSWVDDKKDTVPNMKAIEETAYQRGFEDGKDARFNIPPRRATPRPTAIRARGE